MRAILISTLLILFIQGYAAENTTTDLKLWYNSPASVWEEALPLGNGRIGAMVFGDPLHELYQLNEETLWSGYPKDANNPKAQTALPLIRQAINDGDFKAASELWKKNAQGPYTARYLPMADLSLHMHNSGDVSNLYRDLNISNATTTVKYTVNGVNYTRTSFISYPDQVMVIRLEADKKKALMFDVSMKSALLYKTSAKDITCLELKGKAPRYVASRPEFSEQIVYDEDGEGMTFHVQAKVMLNGGACEANDSVLRIKAANSATIILSAATSFDGINHSPAFQGKDPEAEASKYLKAAASKTYSNVLKTHIADYKALFNRVSISLGENPADKTSLSTSARLKEFLTDDSDKGLIELYYQYGRYLIIASSRQGGKPSNLQGIWNRHVQPPWGSNYTTNINTEMNYWPAETTSLQECHQPLFDMIGLLAENGRETAQTNYGISGWVTHHNTDIWAQTAPTGGYDKDPKGTPRWSCWPMAGAWFCQHLWEHYAFGGDRIFLEEKAYPLMKGAAQFMLEWLQDDASGYLVTNPSSSPENRFFYIDKSGKKQNGEISKATAMDMALIWDLFTNCIQATTILKKDQDFRIILQDAREKLYPPHVGLQGQLQEWYEDFEDVDAAHRHVSHLFGLHPGKQILPRVNPALAAACKKTLELRGDGGTGWAMAWKINFWARLEDGNHAYSMLKNGLKYADAAEVAMKGGGTYANLFDAHPPFQIDGNFGGTAGITEMLIQSHGGEIFLLPALPDNWPNGNIKGIRTRGGFIVDMEWKKGKISKVKIQSTLGGNCRIRTGITLQSIDADLRTARGENPNPFFFTHSAPKLINEKRADLSSLSLPATYVLDFDTSEGKLYELIVKENEDPRDVVTDNFEFATKQLTVAFNEMQDAIENESDSSIHVRNKNGWSELTNPRSLESDGSLIMVPSKDWCSGFFPGELWYMYEYTKDEKWKQLAHRHTIVLERECFNGKTHDMGFKLYCSYGNGHRLTKSPVYEEVLIKAAKTLMTRFDPTVGAIRSWDFNKVKWDYPVIIDNMINLELLFWATKATGDNTYYNAAVSHARVTMKNHFREDYSCYHVVDYNPLNGEVRKRNTHQGYSDDSAWARGQAWAIYGFIMCYRETGIKEFLEQAKNVANYIFTHPNLPADLIPYWDYNAPNIPNEPRDVSAAACTASALYELSLYDETKSAQYKEWANTILNSITNKHRAELGQHKGFLLLNSTGARMSNLEVNVPLVYADYYFLEALLRKQKLEQTNYNLTR